jgi:hypothetical protein
MKADYDSEADALSIELIDVDRWDDGGELDEHYCTVAFSKGRPANIGLLHPSENLHLLEVAADRFDLDPDDLIAAAKAALAAPDRAVTLSGRLASSR